METIPGTLQNITTASNTQPTIPIKDIILINGTRVLMPTEYEKLRAAMITPAQHEIIKCLEVERSELKPEATESIAKITRKINYMQRYPTQCDMLYLTGMRGVEAAALKSDWYRPARRVIVIPDGACKKQKCVYTNRTVMLSLAGCDAVERYLNSGIPLIGKVPMRDALRRYAIKAGIGADGVTTKMFRKSCASGLMAAYPEQEMYISASMGHTREVLQRHYLGLGFPRLEIELVREKYQKDWGMRI